MKEVPAALTTPLRRSLFVVVVMSATSCRCTGVVRPDVVTTVKAAAPSASVRALPTSVPGYDPTIVRVCADDAAAYCAWKNGCAPDRLRAIFLDVAHCTDARFWECLVVDAPVDSTIGAPKLASCLKSRMSAACSAPGFDDPVGCRPNGTRPDGAACRVEAQCRSGYCDFDHGSTGGGAAACGVCALKPAVVLSPTKGIGAACSGDECDRNLSCIHGKCVAPPKLGEPCATTSAPDDCEYPLARCDTEKHLCVRAAFALPGEGCGEQAGHFGDCAGRASCVAGKCVLAPTFGEACVEDDSSCPYGARCVNHVCTVVECH